MNLTDRQRQIVDHAIEMIGEGGLASLTMRRLSDRLGVTEPALYRHFENKTAILAAMILVLEAETYERLPFGKPVAPEALVTHFNHLFNLLSERPALATIVFLDEFASADPELQAMVRSLLSKNRERIANAFASMAPRENDGTPPGTVPDADSLATLLLGGIRLVVREWRLDGCSWNLGERGGRLVAALIDTMKGRSE